MKILKKIVMRLIRGRVSQDRSREIEQMFDAYHFSLFESATPMVVTRLDSDTDGCGLADRLRGMVSSYAYAKCINLPFRIVHRNPFSLEEFLVPNKYDWIAKDNEVSYNLKNSRPVYVMNRSKGQNLPLLSHNKQIHLFTNVNFLPLLADYYHQDFAYHQLYDELFKPSEALQKELDKYHHYVEKGYVSVSFRFLQLMGDFKDTSGEVLNEKERAALISKCHRFLDGIHQKHPNCFMLVTADSRSFLDTLTDFEYIFTIPGEIGHVGYASNANNLHMKTFLDFYMISYAEKVYLGYTDKMYKSNFARSAAAITNAPFEMIEF